MKKKQLLGSGCAAVLVLLLIGIWNLWFSSTRVAFVNYQVISLGQISKANDNSFIKIAEVSTDELDKLTSYDMVFINAMGMRVTEEQRAQIQKAAQGRTAGEDTEACRWRLAHSDHFRHQSCQ